METVGFIGLGNMGMGMGGNIQKADYPMVRLSIFATVPCSLSSRMVPAPRVLQPKWPA